MKVILILIFIVPIYSIAGEREEAMKNIQKAILSYPRIKKAKKAIEKRAMSYIPIKKETFGIISGIALSSSRGYLDTKVIKRMNFKVIGADVRPNLRYDFKDGHANGTINMKWNF